MAHPVDFSISDMLASEGFTSPEAQAAARAALEEAGLTRPGKTRMAAEKRTAAHEAIAARLARACADCLDQEDPGDRLLVEVAAEGCPHCRGSVNRRAVQALAQACARAGVRRVLVVGGTPVLHATLAQLGREAGGPDWRFIEATEKVRTKDEAGAHLKWADVAVIWAPSPLPHKVSNLYTEHPGARHARLATCHQRGIAALCATVMRALGGGGA